MSGFRNGGVPLASLADDRQVRLSLGREPVILAERIP